MFFLKAFRLEQVLQSIADGLEDRQKLRCQSAKQPLYTGLDAGHRIAKRFERSHILLAHHGANLVRLLGEPGQLCRSGLDQWIELLGRFSEELHGQRVALGLVLDLAQPVDHIVEYSLAVTEMAVAIVHSHTQLLEGFGCIAHLDIADILAGRLGIVQFFGIVLGPAPAQYPSSGPALPGCR